MSSTLRRLIYEQLSNDEQIAGMLCSYGNTPALFYQKAPSDSRDNWEEPRYPRMDFNIDTRQDYGRNTAGTMIFNIWVSNDCVPVGDMDPDRAIETRLIELISGTFYTSRDTGIICAEWGRSDEFIVENEYKNAAHPEIYGLTVTFELLDFPEQFTTDPDPVIGLNTWIKTHFNAATVIAFDDMPDVWKPSDENPAVYWRFVGITSNNKQSYAGNWYTGTFAAHIIADTVKECNRWLKSIIERMQLDGEIILPDDGPMFIENVSINFYSDPLQEGQLRLEGRYGVEAQHRKETAQPPINNRHFTSKSRGSHFTLGHT